MFNILYKILVGIDQIFNAILLGDIDETLSSRLYRRREDKGWRFWYNLVNTLFFFQEDHCMRSFLYEYQKRLKFHTDNKDTFMSIPYVKLEKYSKF